MLHPIWYANKRILGIVARAYVELMAGPWTSIIALGALTGFLGQATRVVGLKKTKDQAAALQQAFTEMLEPSTLLISLLIGAGALAAIMTLKPEAAISPETLLGLAAAGYSGADFIEGFVSRYLTSGAIQAATPQHAAGPADSPARSWPDDTARP